MTAPARRAPQLPPTRRRLLGPLVASLLAAASAGAVSSEARAQSEIVVTTTDDELNTDGDCSLREAVVAVNTEAPVDACTGGPGIRNIHLEPVEYQLTIPGAGEDAAATGDLDLLRPAIIDAVGPVPAVIDGGGLDRIFDVHPSAYPIGTGFNSVVLRNGDAGDADGGAIRLSDVVCDGSPGSHRDVSLFGVVIDGNRAARGGGLHVGSCNLVVIIGASIVRNAATDVGGGVSIEGLSVLSFDTSTISTNVAGSAGGGIWANLTYEEANSWDAAFSTIAENRAPDGAGLWTGGSTYTGSSVLAHNDGGNCGGPGATTAGGVADDETCGDDGVDDAGLLPLTTEGNFPVHLLASDSPAIEAAGEPQHGNGWCSGNALFDQVGTMRPLDGDGDGIAECDAGAIEAPAMAVASPSPSPAAPIPDTALSDPISTNAAVLAVALFLGATSLALRARRRPR